MRVGESNALSCQAIAVRRRDPRFGVVAAQVAVAEVVGKNEDDVRAICRRVGGGDKCADQRTDEECHETGAMDHIVPPSLSTCCTSLITWPCANRVRI